MPADPTDRSSNAIKTVVTGFNFIRLTEYGCDRILARTRSVRVGSETGKASAQGRRQLDRS